MLKIERVITNCCECRYAKEFQEMNGNTDYVLICTEKEDDSTSGFMIARSHNKIKNYHEIEIPENCPLMDFKEEIIQIDKP